MNSETYGLLVFREPGPQWHAEPGEPMTKPEATKAVQAKWGEGFKARMFAYKAAGGFPLPPSNGKNFTGAG